MFKEFGFVWYLENRVRQFLTGFDFAGRGNNQSNLKARNTEILVSKTSVRELHCAWREDLTDPCGEVKWPFRGHIIAGDQVGKGKVNGGLSFRIPLSFGINIPYPEIQF